MELQKKQITGIELVKSILAKSKPIAILEMSLKISDTLDKPVIKKVFRDNDEVGFTFINAIIKRFIDSFGFSTKMTETQVEILTIDTLERFGYESVEDIILFFKMARSGQLGATNRGVDSNLIFGDWFPKYMEIKSVSREQKMQKQKIDLSMDKRGASLESVLNRKKKEYDRKFKKDQYNKAVAYADHITKGITRDRLEEIIIEWSNHEVRKDYLDIIKRKRKEIKS